MEVPRFAELPNVNAGTPGLSNKKVVPQGLVKVNIKSPTQLCLALILTFKSAAAVIVVAGKVIVVLTPAGAASGISRSIKLLYGMAGKIQMARAPRLIS